MGKASVSLAKGGASLVERAIALAARRRAGLSPAPIPQQPSRMTTALTVAVGPKVRISRRAPPGAAMPALAARPAAARLWLAVRRGEKDHGDGMVGSAILWAKIEP